MARLCSRGSPPAASAFNRADSVAASSSTAAEVQLPAFPFGDGERALGKGLSMLALLDAAYPDSARSLSKAPSSRSVLSL